MTKTENIRTKQSASFYLIPGCRGFRFVGTADKNGHDASAKTHGKRVFHVMREIGIWSAMLRQGRKERQTRLSSSLHVIP